MTMRAMARAGLCFAFLTVCGTAVADPAAAAPPALTASAVFDKSAYVSGDEVSVEFSVHNSATTPAVGIRAQDSSGPTELVLDQDGFGKFGDGVTIPAGGTVTATLSGHLQSLTATKVTLAGDLFNPRGNGVATFSSSAPVTVRTATVGGQVFGDANSNGRADPGEGMSGVKLRFSYVYSGNHYVVTTGSGGRFSLVVPTASYYVTGSGNRWNVIPEDVTVGAAGADLSLRAVRPLGDVLEAALHFTKDTYAPGDTVHIVVTLTNTGSSTLRGIGAACDRVGDPDELQNTGSGWGDLAFDAPGVTLLAHQTRTFDVTDKVPAGAQGEGEVAAACDFGYRGIEAGDRPTASDTAKVPGLFGTLAGEIEYYPHGHRRPAVGLANVRVVLVDPTTCPVFTRSATTDATGRFRFAHAPAGVSYELYIYPPSGWKVVRDDPTRGLVFGNDTTHFSAEVEHGSAGVPPVPTTCGSSSPSPTPPTIVPIANTGADPAGLAGVGGGAIVAGLILALFGRRRRAH